MKYKMTYRLIGYFSAVLLLFAVAVGGMLMFLSSKQMTEAYEEELKARAVSISETLSAFSRGEGQMPGMESSQGHGHGKGAGSGTAGGYGDKKASSALPLDFSTKGRKAPPLRKRKELFPNLSGSIFRKEEGEYP